jgi:nitroreductase
MSDYSFIPLPPLPDYPDQQRIDRAREFLESIQRRRTVRDFSGQPVPREVIEQCLLAAGTAPNGANLQPWHFCVVEDPAIKREIRLAAEKEEREFYQSRATTEWLADLAPLGTDEKKPFLEIAPTLIVIFARAWRRGSDGKRLKNYYVAESVGIATGFLINALHHCGLATLTHTPSPMKFLNAILGRPENERPYLVLVVGHPAKHALVPAISKLPLNELATFYEAPSSKSPTGTQ